MDRRRDLRSVEALRCRGIPGRGAPLRGSGAPETPVAAVWRAFRRVG